MDKRYTALSLPDQLALWLTSAEMAKLAGVSTKTMQDIEQGRSEGTVQTMSRIFGMLGLKLGVVRQSP
ncbi:transcriptional regulator [Burkholderia multivorans]|uniref:helix-turn-helix domain-containing protein n=1 Tax=Burkholderia ubonensis TaxID=101571 RepID=UPI000F6FCBDC|nr:transcriptional regulator [Burkholderia ubonensis]AYZ63182.1 transcriptional regulator [Burkholderia multivorans]